MSGFGGSTMVANKGTPVSLRILMSEAAIAMGTSNMLMVRDGVASSDLSLRNRSKRLRNGGCVRDIEVFLRCLIFSFSC